MTTWRMLLSLWVWEPSVLLGCLALLVAYLQIARPLTARAALFALGDAVLLLALVSPLDTLGDRYLFSAHMLQHLLLVLVVPPLLLLGTPPSFFARLLRCAPARRVERMLGRPAVAWLLGMCTLWLWHAPALYEAALANEGIHIMQHLSFLVSATIFWWPVIAPAPLRRLRSWAAVPYLLASSVTSSVLGVILTFAAPGLYPSYLHPVDTLGILPLLRAQWGLTARADQQLGGLLMWMLSSPIYLAGLVAALARWYTEPEWEDINIADAPILCDEAVNTLSEMPEPMTAPSLAAPRPIRPQSACARVPACGCRPVLRRTGPPVRARTAGPAGQSQAPARKS